MGRISQGYVSNGLSKEFKKKFLKKYELRSYTDPRKPAFFFGIYNDTDLSMVNRHHALAVIIWGGNDIIRALGKTRYRPILSKRNIKHLAISSDISKDITKLKLKPYPAVFSLAQTKLYSAVPLGPYVYIYTNSKHPARYGEKYYLEIRKRFPDIKFILANHNTYTQEQLVKVYQSCFLGLRLTDHDGNANTVQELGLCGIRCVHNGSLPGTIPWKNLDDIAKAITEERTKVGKPQLEVAKAMKTYLESEPKWLHTSYYGGEADSSKKNNPSEKWFEPLKSVEQNLPGLEVESTALVQKKSNQSQNLLKRNEELKQSEEYYSESNSSFSDTPFQPVIIANPQTRKKTTPIPQNHPKTSKPIVKLKNAIDVKLIQTTLEQKANKLPVNDQLNGRINNPIISEKKPEFKENTIPRMPSPSIPDLPIPPTSDFLDDHPPLSSDPYSVTVIMNVYHEKEPLLAAAINSYLAQKGVRLQLIISTLEDDPCIGFIKKKYGNRPEISFCLCKKSEHPGRGHLGIYYQLNKAVPLIRHRWYAYASSNDVAVNNKLYNEIKACLKGKKRVCYSAFTITDQNLKNGKVAKFHAYNYGKHLTRNFVNDCALIESKLLREFMHFRSDRYRNHAYWDLWLRIYERYGDVFIYNSKPSFYYRTHKGALHIQTKNNDAKKKENQYYRELMITDHKKLKHK